MSSSVIREGLGVELLPLHIKRIQFRWLRHLNRMPPGRGISLERHFGHVIPGGGLGQSQDSLKRLSLACLGKTSCHPR